MFGYGCLAVISSAIIGTAGTIAWWAGDRRLPVNILTTEVITPEVKPGGRLTVRQKIEYVRDCPAHVDRTVYDDATHREFLPDIDYERPPTGLGIRTVTFEIDIPPFFVPGMGTYRAQPNYWCNPLQKFWWPISRPETVIPFTIMRPD